MKTSFKTINTCTNFINLAFFIAIPIACGFHLKDVYQNYWGAPNQTPQGTIYAVQTVEYNIAGHGMPALASKALKNNEISLLQSITDSAFGLTGFVITRCAYGSDKNTCIGEKVVSITTLGFGWLNNDNVHALIENADFKVLTSDYGAGVDWTYKGPKDDSIVINQFEPEGDVIGRLYYVRRPAPSFASQVKRFLLNPFSEGSDIKHYQPIAFSYLLFLFIAIGLVSILSRKWKESVRLENDKIAIETSLNEIQNEKISEEAQKNRLTIDLFNTQNELKINQERLNCLDQAYAEKTAQEKRLSTELESTKLKAAELAKDSDELEKMMEIKRDIEHKLHLSEKEKQDVWKERLEAEEKLEKQFLIQKDLQQKHESLELKLAEKEAKISKLENQIKSSKKTLSVSEKIFDAFMDGLNISTEWKISYIEEVYSDLNILVKSGISIISINNVIAKIAKVASSDTMIHDHFSKIERFESVFHNKKAHIRVYFHIGSHKSIKILSIWDQAHAPHAGLDIEWKHVEKRLKRISDTT